jgi:hypothetical protein
LNCLNPKQINLKSQYPITETHFHFPDGKVILLYYPQSGSDFQISNGNSNLMTMIAPRNPAAAPQAGAIKFHKSPKLFYPGYPGNLRIKPFDPPPAD